MDIKEKAKEMYLAGMPLVDIARHLKKPDYAIRKWKFKGDWDNSKRDKKIIDGTHIPLEADTNKKIDISNRELNSIKKEFHNIDDEGLCENRKNFCLHYIKTFNGTQSALRAGYSPKSAHVESTRLLKDDRVKRYLNKLKQQYDSTDYLDAKRVLARHKEIAFSDITDFVKLDSLGDYSDDDNPKIKLKDYSGIDGTLIKKVGVNNYGVIIELEDRAKSLEFLTKYYSLDPSFKITMDKEDQKLVVDKLKLKLMINPKYQPNELELKILYTDDILELEKLANEV